MKKLFATALMAMSMGSVFAQDNIVANDTVKTDTTKNCPAKGCQKSLAALISNDTVTTDSTKAKLTAMLACVAMNDRLHKIRSGCISGTERHSYDRQCKSTTGSLGCSQRYGRNRQHESSTGQANSFSSHD